MKPRRAFTLPELLVVLGIIVLLVAILLPALAKAREQARQAVCASNQRQIVLAMLMYANENKGVLPMPVDSGQPSVLFPCAAVQLVQLGQYSWNTGAIYRYLSADPQARQRLFNCPSDDGDPRSPMNPYTGVPYQLPRNFSYNFNELLCSIVSPLNSPTLLVGSPIRLGKIQGADHKILVMEMEMPYGSRGVVNIIVQPAHGPNTVAPQLTTRHTARANEGFADGHVEALDGSIFNGTLASIPGAPPNSYYTANLTNAYLYYVDLLHPGFGPN